MLSLTPDYFAPSGHSFFTKLTEAGLVWDQFLSYFKDKRDIDHRADNNSHSISPAFLLFLYPTEGHADLLRTDSSVCMSMCVHVPNWRKECRGGNLFNSMQCLKFSFGWLQTLTSNAQVSHPPFISASSSSHPTPPLPLPFCDLVRLA